MTKTNSSTLSRVLQPRNLWLQFIGDQIHEFTIEVIKEQMEECAEICDAEHCHRAAVNIRSRMRQLGKSVRKRAA